MRAGEVIDGRFAVERFVARGGMGEVWRALDRNTGQPVALKLIATDDAQDVARLGLEARALGALDHPAIVRLVAHAPCASGAYLAMEWLDGLTLAAWLQHRSLSVSDTLRLGARVADALAAAHARGLVHRDIKPGNLFLVGRRVDAVKLLDFGLARDAWRELSLSSAGMGTPEYMAPEQVRGERTIGPSTDVYALGAVLYRCLAGRPPFEGGTLKAMLAKIAMFERPPRVREVRAEIAAPIDELVASLMAAASDARPRDGADAAARLVAARSALTAPATPPADTGVTSAEHAPAAIIYVDLPEGASADAVTDAAALAGARAVAVTRDAVVVSFDAAAAAPELAARAARCALAIRERVPGATFSIASRRIDASAALGAAPLIDTAVAAAVAGRIRIDRATREHLPATFIVAGDDDSGHELVGERDETEPRRFLGRATSFVGRQPIVRQLRAVIDGVVEDRAPRAVVVVGEAGLGKSRLRAELLGVLRTRGIATLRAGGEPLRAGVPGGLFARAIRSTLGGAPAAKLGARLADDVRARTVDFLREMIGDPVGDEAGPSLRAARQDPRFRAEQEQRAVEDWVAAECAARPVAIVLDDLQWSDARSLELVEAVLRKARGLPLFVVAFARPEVHERFPNLDAAWRCDLLRLEPLREAACEQLVREALGPSVPDETVARLVEHSGGNPFYLEELIRGATSAEPASLPGSVLASLQLRIGAKPARARLVLRAASVFGRVFWGGAVASLVVGEMDRAELDEWLALLERDELVERRGPARAFAGELEYAFRHDLLKDASYQMLTPEDRRAGHRLAGAWLVAHGEADAVVLAEHFAGGGATAQAVNWFERAAEGALAGGADDVAAMRKAAAYYRRAGETCAAAYANDAAIGHLERAAALFASIDPVEAARTRLALAKVREVFGEPDAALEDLRAAEEEAAKSVELRVEILLARSYVLGRSGREGALDRGIETAEMALALAKDAGGQNVELRATTTLAGLLARMETAASIQRSVELAQRALAMSEDRRDLGLAVWRLANAFLTGNQLDSAARLYDDALVSAEAERDEYLVAMCHANMAMLAFRRWRLDEAIDHAHQALERHERIGYQTRILETTLNLGMFLHLRGESERGRELLGNVLAQSRSDWFLSTLAQETLADVERVAGREARAQARLRSAARTCERVGIPNKQALYLGMLAESLWATGHANAAIAMLDASAAADKAPTLSRGLVRLYLGEPSTALELLAAQQGLETDPQRRALAHLALGRGHLWMSDRAAARTACDAALAILAPSPVPRFTLPPRSLLAILDGDLGSALRLLGQIQSACAPYEHAEATLDVGLAVLDTDADRALVDAYLELSRDVRHRGLRPHIEQIRARLFARIGDDAAARSAAERASTELRAVLDGVPDTARAAFAAHPLVARLHTALPARAPTAPPSAPATTAPPAPARYGVSPPSSARTATLARWLVEQLLALPNERSPELVIDAGPAAGERLRLPPPPARIAIGSGAGADWQLADPALADAHVVIERSIDGVRATRASRASARTRDGTLPTAAPGALLADGDVIELGATRLRYLDPATALERALDEQLETAAAPTPEIVGPRFSIGFVIAMLIAVTAVVLAVWMLL